MNINNGGLSGKTVEQYCIDNRLDYFPKKDSYVKWKSNELITFTCLECGKYAYETKSLRYWEKRILNKPFYCLFCKTEKIKNIPKVELLPLQYREEEIPYKLREKLLTKPDWKMITYISARDLSIFQCIRCGFIKKMPPHMIFVDRHDSCLQCNDKKIVKLSDDEFLKKDNEIYDL